MATYPTLATRYGADPKAITSPEIDRAEDGTARARSYGADKVEFRIEHPFLDSTDKSALDAFYTTNRLLAFDYVSLSDGATRSCLFGAPLEWTREPGGRYTARVRIVEA
jgi:hypothetical protein